jgi:hypothetical protein
MIRRRPKRGRESNSEGEDPIKRTKTEDEETPSTGELTVSDLQAPREDEVSTRAPFLSPT